MAYTTFYDVLNDLMALPGLDIYVTGSNSRMLSKDIATNFRDRGDEIRMFPLSFGEYYAMACLEKADAWAEYVVYCGMPLAVLEKDENERARYLGLYERVYVAGVVERYGVQHAYLENLIDVVASISAGSEQFGRLKMNAMQKTHLSGVPFVANLRLELGIKCKIQTGSREIGDGPDICFRSQS